METTGTVLSEKLSPFRKYFVTINALFSTVMMGLCLCLRVCAHLFFSFIDRRLPEACSIGTAPWLCGVHLPSYGPLYIGKGWPLSTNLTIVATVTEMTKDPSSLPVPHLKLDGFSACPPHHYYLDGRTLDLLTLCHSSKDCNGSVEFCWLAPNITSLVIVWKLTWKRHTSTNQWFDWFEPYLLFSFSLGC